MASAAYESMSSSSLQARLKALLLCDYPDLRLVKADDEVKAAATVPVVAAISSSSASIFELVVEV
jgi:hypothetical protein